MKSQQFKFTIPLPRDYEIQLSHNADSGRDDEWLILRGIASDTAIDSRKGQMTPECIFGMVDTINARSGTRSPIFENSRAAKTEAIRPEWLNADGSVKPVGLDVDHSNIFIHQIGYLMGARALQEADLSAAQKSAGVKAPAMEVVAAVDLGMSAGRDLKRAVDRGDQLGLSIYGEVKSGRKVVMKSEAGLIDVVKRFEQVNLLKVAVTTTPINPNAWVDVVARSAAFDDADIEEMAMNPQTAQEALATEEAQETETAPAVLVGSAEQEAAPVVAPKGEANKTGLPDEVLAHILEERPVPVADDSAEAEAEADSVSGEILQSEAAPAEGTAPPVQRSEAPTPPAEHARIAAEPDTDYEDAPLFIQDSGVGAPLPVEGDVPSIGEIVARAATLPDAATRPSRLAAEHIEAAIRAPETPQVAAPEVAPVQEATPSVAAPEPNLEAVIADVVRATHAHQDQVREALSRLLVSQETTPSAETAPAPAPAPAPEVLAQSAAAEGVAPTEPAPEAAPQSAPEIISSEPFSGYTLFRSEVEADLEELHELLLPMPTFIERAESRISALEGLVESQSEYVKALEAVLSQRIDTVAAAPLGRRGFSVAALTAEMIARGEHGPDPAEAQREAEAKRQAAISQAMLDGDMRAVERLTFGRFQRTPTPVTDPFNIAEKAARYQEALQAEKRAQAVPGAAPASPEAQAVPESAPES